MTQIRTYCLLAVALLTAAFSGCRHQPQPAPPSYAGEFTTGYLEDYGAYYAEEGLFNRVFALDLYSDGLTLNKKGYIEGSGTNLYFSDIFVEPQEKTLPAATYEAAETGEPLTFLPGKHFEGQITGAYLLRISDGSIVEMTILPKGKLTLSYDGPEVILHFEGITYEKRAYTADFFGVFTKKNRTGSLKTKPI